MAKEIEQYKYKILLKRSALYLSQSKSVEYSLLLIQGFRALQQLSSLSPNTLRTYSRAIEDFISFFSGVDLLHKVSPEEIQRYITHLGTPQSQPVQVDRRRGRPRSRGALSRNSIAVRLSAIKQLFDMFVWAGLCAYNPLNVVQRPDSKMPAPKLVFYTNIELVEMLSVSVIHDEVLLLLGAHAGLRAGEIIDLRWHDVSLDDQILQVGEGNGVTVQMSNRLALSLQELYEDAHYSNGMSRYILDLRTQYGVYNRVRNICRAANVDFKGVQGLRNHCGRSVLIKTGDARAVQRHLRLKSIEQVQRFSSQDNTFSIEIADL